jgi:hypothetical protein
MGEIDGVGCSGSRDLAKLANRGAKLGKPYALFRTCGTNRQDDTQPATTPPVLMPPRSRAFNRPDAPSASSLKG